jgi:hypothetical protein
VVQTPDTFSNLSHTNKYNILKLITLKLIKIDKVVDWEVNTSYIIQKTKMEFTACTKLQILSSLFLYGGMWHRNPWPAGSQLMKQQSYGLKTTTETKAIIHSNFCNGHYSYNEVQINQPLTKYLTMPWGHIKEYVYRSIHS